MYSCVLSHDRLLGFIVWGYHKQDYGVILFCACNSDLVGLYVFNHCLDQYVYIINII